MPCRGLGLISAPHRLHLNDAPSAYMKNPVDSRQLCAFYYVARSGSFTEGGRALHLSQSAVSRAIQALEDDVGAAHDRLAKR
jgi:hypothetical protein